MQQVTETKKRTPRFFYGYVVVLAAFVIWVVSRGTFQTYGVFFKPMLSEFSWTRAMVSGARSLSSAIEGLLGIVAGTLTDRFGPRKVVFLLGSLVGISFILMSQVQNLWQFYIVMGVLVGIGMSATGTPTMTAVAKWFARRRGLMAGIVQAGSGVGGMVLSPLAGMFILTMGWRQSYFIIGAAGLVLIVLSALSLRRDPGEMGQSPYGADEAAVQAVKDRKPNSKTGGFSLKSAVRTRQFWMLWLLLFSYGLCRSVMMVHLAAHTIDLGFSLTVGANMLATMSGVALIGGIGMGRIADFIGNRRVVTIGYTVMVASLFWILVADELWELYLFAAAFGFSWGAVAVMRMPITAEIFGLGSLGAILGAVDFGTHAGSTFGPLLGGWLFDVTDKYTVAFLSSAVIASIGLILTMFLRPVKSGD